MEKESTEGQIVILYRSIGKKGSSYNAILNHHGQGMSKNPARNAGFFYTCKNTSTIIYSS